VSALPPIQKLLPGGSSASGLDTFSSYAGPGVNAPSALGVGTEELYPRMLRAVGLAPSPSLAAVMRARVSSSRVVRTCLPGPLRQQLREVPPTAPGAYEMDGMAGLVWCAVMRGFGGVRRCTPIFHQCSAAPSPL